MGTSQAEKILALAQAAVEELQRLGLIEDGESQTATMAIAVLNKNITIAVRDLEMTCEKEAKNEAYDRREDEIGWDLSDHAGEIGHHVACMEEIYRELQDNC